MVVIRLARYGAKHAPKYRILVSDSKERATTGNFIENLGHYNPSPRGEETGLKLDVERANQWIKKGAKASDRVQALMRRAQNG